MHPADDDDDFSPIQGNAKYQEWVNEQREARRSPPHRPESKPKLFFGELFGTLIAVGLLVLFFFL